MSIGLLILRVVAGLTLAAHGSQKLFDWFGGYGLAGTGGFFNHLQGYEYTMMLAVIALSVAITGPGAISLDAVLGVHAAGPAWGLAAAVLGLAGAGIQLAGRRVPVAQEAQKAS